jgi:DNA-binding winged helix-turn-helix (wHTH) protein
LLEVLESGKKLNPSPKHCGFLLTLLKNPQETVTYDELRKTVWTHQTKVDEFFIRNVHSTKNNLIKLFKTIGAETDFIKSIPGEGYFLDATVSEVFEIDGDVSEERYVNLQAENSSSDDADEIIQILESLPKPEKFLLNRHFAYISSSSLLYGLLFWLALVLEIAYQFDRFGTMVLWLGLPLILWITCTSLAGLTWTKRLVHQEKRKALFVGLAFFICGAIVACLAMSYFLPDEPITAARFQTQPAFAAFLKNSLIYFLPLGVIFILIPFHYVCVQQYEVSKTSNVSSKTGSFILHKSLINLRPSFLFGIWSVMVTYSIFSTFYLLDNLLIGEYHSLFVILTFLRFFVFFGLGLVCLIWYNSQRAVR